MTHNKPLRMSSALLREPERSHQSAKLRVIFLASSNPLAHICAPQFVNELVCGRCLVVHILGQ